MCLEFSWYVLWHIHFIFLCNYPVHLQAMLEYSMLNFLCYFEQYFISLQICWKYPLLFASDSYYWLLGLWIWSLWFEHWLLLSVWWYFAITAIHQPFSQFLILSCDISSFSSSFHCLLSWPSSCCLEYGWSMGLVNWEQW